MFSMKKKNTPGLTNNQSKLHCQNHLKLKKIACGVIYAKVILVGFTIHCSINLKKDFVFLVVEFR